MAISAKALNKPLYGRSLVPFFSSVIKGSSFSRLVFCSPRRVVQVYPPLVLPPFSSSLVHPAPTSLTLSSSFHPFLSLLPAALSRKPTFLPRYRPRPLRSLPPTTSMLPSRLRLPPRPRRQRLQYQQRPFDR